jgi:hypothetical protein
MDAGSGATAVDRIAGNDGTINGAEWTPGGLGSALDFDGADDDYVDLNGLDISGDQLTLAAWVYPKAYLEEDARIITKAINRNVESHVFMLSTVGSDHRLRFRLKTGSDLALGTETLEADSAGVVPLDTWTHVAATYDAITNTMKVFTNGVERGSLPHSGSIHSGSGYPTRIGLSQQDAGTAAPWDGKLDDVRIYERALTAAEIQAAAGLP